ncbi:MAG: hypothetical protein ACE5ES_03535 [Candidatus Nanoarchaeia archaeon]
MAKKKKQKKQVSQPQVEINVFDLAGALMPQLVPLAKRIAKELIELIDEIPSQLVLEKPKKVVQKKTAKKKAKVDYRHDRCKCGNVKTKDAKYCRDCWKKKLGKKRR